jgi:hypothetical protein
MQPIVGWRCLFPAHKNPHGKFELQESLETLKLLVARATGPSATFEHRRRWGGFEIKAERNRRDAP